MTSQTNDEVRFNSLADLIRDKNNAVREQAIVAVANEWKIPLCTRQGEDIRYTNPHLDRHLRSLLSDLSWLEREKSRIRESLFLHSDAIILHRRNEDLLSYMWNILTCSGRDVHPASSESIASRCEGLPSLSKFPLIKGIFHDMILQVHSVEPPLHPDYDLLSKLLPDVASLIKSDVNIFSDAMGELSKALESTNIMAKCQINHMGEQYPGFFLNAYFYKMWIFGMERILPPSVALQEYYANQEPVKGRTPSERERLNIWYSLFRSKLEGWLFPDHHAEAIPRTGSRELDKRPFRTVHIRSANEMPKEPKHR